MESRFGLCRGSCANLQADLPRRRRRHGKPGFQQLKRMLFVYVEGLAPEAAVSPARYRLGLVRFCLPLVSAWLEPTSTRSGRASGQSLTVPAPRRRGVRGELLRIGRRLLGQDPGAVRPDGGGRRPGRHRARRSLRGRGRPLTRQGAAACPVQWVRFRPQPRAKRDGFRSSSAMSASTPTARRFTSACEAATNTTPRRSRPSRHAASRARRSGWAARRRARCTRQAVIASRSRGR